MSTYELLNRCLLVRPKKIILLFPEIRVTRKIFTRAAANLFIFYSIFWWYSLFVISFFCFFLLLFFVVVCLMFFEPNPLSANPTKWLNTLKQFVGTLHILMHIRLYGRVSDKMFFTRSISGRRLVFFQSHIVRLEGLHGKVNWNQVIINFTLFEITTKKSLYSSDTHLQTSSGRFSWKLDCSCGLWLKSTLALDIRGKNNLKNVFFFGHGLATAL